ncbi:MAG: MAPEG family protein [Asticcacaulis sp.]
MVDKYLVLWPMAAMAALTFIVLSLVPMFRAGDVTAGRIGTHDFKLGESERVPESTRLYNRNYMNLLELPVLFYIVCLVIFVTDKANWIEVNLAWGFVLFRAVHTWVHLTINVVLLRTSLFATSTFILMFLWILAFWAIVGL